MNGKKAKQMRRAARALNLPKQTTYAPSGGIAPTGQFYQYRPFAMQACERKAIKEAKRLYKGQVKAGEEYFEPVHLMEKGRAFRDAVVDSMNKQTEAPSLGGPSVR